MANKKNTPVLSLDNEDLEAFINETSEPKLNNKNNSSKKEKSISVKKEVTKNPIKQTNTLPTTKPKKEKNVLLDTDVFLNLKIAAARAGETEGNFANTAIKEYLIKLGYEFEV